MISKCTVTSRIDCGRAAIYVISGLQQGKAIMIDVPPNMPPQHVIADKLVACGLDRGAISVAWKDELQSIVVVIRRDVRVSPKQFACINKAAAVEIVTFEDKSLQSAYTAYTAELFRPRMIAESKAAVTKLRLLKGFPQRSNYADLRSYTEALERHCGLMGGNVLRVSGDTVTFEPPPETDFLGFTKRYEKILAAVRYAGAIGDLEKFGFIGSEAIADTNE